MKASFALLATAVLGDVYMHNPRGSNNRLNEQSANRNNGNRLYDSQNNNRGGYNVGDKTDEAFDPNNPEGGILETYSVNAADMVAMQYPMVFLEGSILPVEWTNQHGCGGNEENDPHKLNCNMVIQYTCDTDPQVVTDPAMRVELHDGGNTNTPDEPNTYAQALGATKASNDNNNRGRQESEASYYECKKRERNYGLFTADQNLNNADARSTRQNPGGNRRGLECPEERDYYPYWYPSIWSDVAYVTDATDVMCGPQGYIAQNSQNNNPVYKCVGPAENDQTIPITESGCEAAGGTWTEYTKNIAAPDCVQAEWTRVNHLGNNRHGQPVTYNWTLPTAATMPTGVRWYEGQYARCAVRLRYNISTDDYDPWAANSTMNQQNNQKSPVEQNPVMPVRMGTDLQGLRLAINTAQFGRTFQDRSHVFTIKKRPAAVPASARVFNLNVRGKRGNIVQTFPAVEYDFVPNRVHVTRNDFIHVQWTGSNTHNNGNPAGDGQAGDAGEGTGGTDRSNMVQIGNMDANFPLPLDKFTDNMWSNSQCLNFQGVGLGEWWNCALIMMTSGQFRSWDEVNADEWNVTLDEAPASLIGGILMKFNKAGEYRYIGSRNNNFSNRSQKGALIVE